MCRGLKWPMHKPSDENIIVMVASIITNSSTITSKFCSFFLRKNLCRKLVLFSCYDIYCCYIYRVLMGNKTVHRQEITVIQLRTGYARLNEYLHKIKIVDSNKCLTLSYSHPDLLETKNVLTSESEYVIEWFGTNQMQANPGKFQAIVLGKRGYGDCKSFTIHDNTVKCEDSVKLLGVTIDYMLNFDLHISDICKKAARQINVFCRLSRHLSTETKLLIYKSFVRSNFSYCPVVWHFCSKLSTDKMVKTSV